MWVPRWRRQRSRSIGSPARSPRARRRRATRRARYTAVRDATINVGGGEFVSVVGPTGCGKSTLLNVAAGLLAPSAGTVTVFGAPLQRAQPFRRLHVPGRRADAVAQRALECHGGTGVSRHAPGPRASEGARMARSRGPRGIRAPLSASALGRNEEARRARADTHSRSADPADGRAVLGARRADASAHGERAARALERRSEVRALHYPRSRGGDLRSPTASSCCRQVRRRARSASSRSTCRGRATSRTSG